MLNHRLVLSRQTVVVHCFSHSLYCTDCPAVTKFIDTKWKKVYSWQKVTYFFVYTRFSPSSSDSLLSHNCSSQKHCWWWLGSHPYLSREPQLKMYLVHSIAARKQLVAIILSILKCMFYICHLSGVPWLRQSVAHRGGAARPPLNLPLCTTLTSRRHEIQTSSGTFQVPLMFRVI